MPKSRPTTKPLTEPPGDTAPSGGTTPSGGRCRRAVRRVRDRLFRPRTLLWAACLVMLVVFAPRLYHKLPDLTGQDRHRLRAANVHVTAPPHWVPHDMVRQVVERQGWDRQPPSVLEPDLAGRVAQAFAQFPWVERVGSVRKEPPNVVRVELAYRRPVALVEVGQGRYYPVAADSVLLPPADFSRADLGRYPIIRGVRSLPVGPAGSAWGDPVVVGAARLADHLMHRHDRERSHWEVFGFATIEAPPREKAELAVDELTFTLCTHDGARIVWGRAPGTGHPGELSAEQKIGRLKQYQADYGGFTHPAGPLEIDIRHWQEITQRVLSEAPRPSRR